MRMWIDKLYAFLYAFLIGSVYLSFLAFISRFEPGAGFYGLYAVLGLLIVIDYIAWYLPPKPHSRKEGTR